MPGPCFLRLSLLFLSALFPLFFISACDTSAQKAPAERAAPVRLETVKTQNVPRIFDAVGNVEAFSSVQIKSQVSGQIIDVPVSAGKEVQQDEVLFRLDPRPFDAAVAEAEAHLSRNLALLDKAKHDLARYTSLLKQDVISREAFEQIATAEKTVRADIAQYQAALQTAKLNREYSVIRAPVAGKLGDILVRLGNVIKANDERTLVVINSLRPAEVHFSVAERFLPAILDRLKEGPLQVEVLPEGDKGPLISGAVTALNNEVDRTTGSIRLQALFPNEDNRLWPGQFVRVSLFMAMLPNAVVVPEKALQEGISGQYVYVAVPDGNERYRVSTANVSAEKGPGDLVIILSGLRAGDIVVTEGQLGLSPGSLAVDMGARPSANDGKNNE
jgi:multidrug efflux system membrane fusion protein